MRDGTRRVRTSLVQIASLFALALLAAGCAPGGGEPEGASPSWSAAASPLSSSTAVAEQVTFKVHLLADDKALDQGILGYLAPATMNTGDTATLAVEVIDNGKAGKGTEPLPKGTGYVFAPQDVPTGGIVGVVASCQGIACGADGPATQPVLSGMTGNWYWELSAQHPGTARVLLVATTYDQGTDIPLHVTSPIEITITINATPGYWASTIGHWTWIVIGSSLGALVSGGATWLMKRNAKRKAKLRAEQRRKKRAKRGSAAPSQPSEPARR